MLSAGAVVATIAAVAPASAASATGSGTWGYTNYAVGKAGECGSAYSSGVGVTGWQANMWAAHEYTSKSSIDGAFGPDTKAKTQHWQKTRSLTADGCVGYDTWVKAENESDYMGSNSSTRSWKYRPVNHDEVVPWSDFFLCHYVSFVNPADGVEHYTYVATYECADWRSHVETGTQVSNYP